MASSLSSYLYFSTRLALVSLLPGGAYWLLSGFVTGVSVFLVFLVVGQVVAVWTYRKDLVEAFRTRRR